MRVSRAGGREASSLLGWGIPKSPGQKGVTVTSEMPDDIRKLELGISRLEHQLTDVALDVGRRTLTLLQREDHFARPFVAGAMDGASHDSVRVGLDGLQDPSAQLLYLAGFAQGWDGHRARRAG